MTIAGKVALSRTYHYKRAAWTVRKRIEVCRTAGPFRDFLA